MEIIKSAIEVAEDFANYLHLWGNYNIELPLNDVSDGGKMAICTYSGYNSFSPASLVKSYHLYRKCEYLGNRKYRCEI